MGGQSEVTVLIYLNGGGEGDPLRGGRTTFFRDHDPRRVACQMEPRAGFALLHSHGERCLTHEGSTVTAGVKWLLRTDVVYAPTT